MPKKIIPIEFHSIDSTHAFIKRNYLTFPVDSITRVTTNMQTAGKGRSHKNWISSPNQNLCISYFFTLAKTPPDLGNLAQVTTVIVAHLLKSHHLIPQIKWPNDLLVCYKKIAGTLCEWIDVGDKLGIIMSLGLNVNMVKHDLKQIDQPATSMYAELGHLLCLQILTSQLDSLINEAIIHYEREGFEFFRSSYESYLIGQGRFITYLSKGTRQEAIFDHLTSDGRIALRLKTGEVLTVSSGEITSIRF